MKKGIILGLGLMIGSLSFAQDNADKVWTFKGVTGLNASQTALVNWSAGGNNTVALNGFLNVSANYKKERYFWNNNFTTEYGTTYTKSNGWVKSVDRLQLTTTFGYQIAKKWYLASLVDFKTQYDKGYDSPDDENYMSKFMAPGYLNISVGFDYKPNSALSVYLSPINAKMTFVADKYLSDMGAFGVTKGKRLKVEAGALARGTYTKEIMENVTLITKLELFSAYNNHFGNIDVNWENIINMKVNKFLNANIHTNLVYDNDVKEFDAAGNVIKGPRVQFKEMIGVGIAYNF